MRMSGAVNFTPVTRRARACVHSLVVIDCAIWQYLSLFSRHTCSFINSNVYTGADSVACIQLWSLHEQCHQLSGWGVVSLLYLLACALQYRYLNNMQVTDLQ
jgi:hypothetical protein